MDLCAAFCAFTAAMTLTLLSGVNMIWGLAAGWFAFAAVGLRRGFSLKNLIEMSVKGSLGSMVVIRVFVFIGLLTALWRSSGTFALLISYGIQLVTPSLFVLTAFLTSSLLSYAIGTSFGVAGTLGVALMALARSGGVNEVVAAGAVISGIYFGDRASPSSSCANLVAAVTSTRLMDNVKLMMKSALLPYLLSAAFYLFLSVRHPLVSMPESVLAALNSDFHLSHWLAVPAVLMIALPLARVKVAHAFMASIAAAFVCAYVFQERSVSELLRCCVFGFRMEGGALGTLLDGGGLISMVNTSLILLLSSTYSGIFDGTGMLDGVHVQIEKFMKRVGAFPAMVAMAFASNGVFCNQTIGVMISAQLMQSPYEASGASRPELALDIANSTVVLAGIIPWSIACSVPLAMLGVSVAAVPYSVYLYLLPLCYYFTKKRFFPAGAAAQGNE
ncbi:MAG: Na+/H+ antiporter NhaC family protein [Pyramidobacter sp.]|nr:Na+/H+ antiporter NhaC family protein [Pyramidobacter sp.]